MKRLNATLLIVLATMACSLAASATRLTVGGRLAVLDSLTNTYLCPTAKAHFGQDLSALIASDADSLSIDGTAINDTVPFTFASIAGGKRWKLDIVEDSVAVTRYLTFTYLPVMVMNGTFGYDYTQGTIQVLDPDRYSDEEMLARVKWRGGTTNVDGKNKRNYHIKFIDEAGNSKDRKFLGLRNDNSWIMDAGQVDFLRVRNRVATQLWNDMASRPYYADREPKVKTGVDGGMVEVILNGKYAGFYALTEAMDRKTLKLKKYDETTGEIHGQLWKASGLNTTTTLNEGQPYSNYSETWCEFETKYPEFDDVCPTDYKALSDGVWFADTANMAQFNQHAEEHFDMPVMIDYEIFLQALLAVDNYGKNIYWAVYDRAESDKLTLAVWDLDATMGGNWAPSPYHPSTLSPTRTIRFANGIFKRISRPYSIHWQQGIERYKELRKGILSTDSLISRYVNAVNEVKDCGAIEREQARWSRDTDLNGRQLRIEEVELPYLKDWITQRMEFLDETRFADPILGDMNADRIVDISDINAMIDVILSGGSWWSYPVADLNNDGYIDIADLNDEINLIFSQTSATE